MFSLDLNGNNLGLCILSWGLGAEMMYSPNFGFWSSVSFFSPDDFTSGLTGSGGFSLLWPPFVQPFERKEEEKNQYTELLKAMSTQGQYVDGLGGSRCLSKQQKAGAWAWRINGTGQKTTENLQQCWESQRSQLFVFCSRTIPAEGVKGVKILPHILELNTEVCSTFLPSMHRETLGLLGERCRHLLETNQMWENTWLSGKAASKVVCLLYHFQICRSAWVLWLCPTLQKHAHEVSWTF